jgi:hypothetical protein
VVGPGAGAVHADERAVDAGPLVHIGGLGRARLVLLHHHLLPVVEEVDPALAVVCDSTRLVAVRFGSPGRAGTLPKQRERPSTSTKIATMLTPNRIRRSEAPLTSPRRYGRESAEASREGSQGRSMGPRHPHSVSGCSDYCFCLRSSGRPGRMSVNLPGHGQQCGFLFGPPPDTSGRQLPSTGGRASVLGVRRVQQEWRNID